MVINGEEYVKKSDLETKEIGEKRIVVAAHGWVCVGNCVDNEDGTITIRNALNIRNWGTERGLGELINGPLSSTVADEYGTIKIKPLFEMYVSGGW